MSFRGARNHCACSLNRAATERNHAALGSQQRKSTERSDRASCSGSRRSSAQRRFSRLVRCV